MPDAKGIAGRDDASRRRGPIRRLVRRHPVIVTSAGILAVAFIIFVLVWFQPQKLFINKTVNEPLPNIQSSSPVPKVLASGSFRTLEHGTTGRAIVLRRSDGRLILRLERLDTSNGPDLRVYLSQLPASNDLHAYRNRFIDLGPLKANRGNQNYAIPAGADLSKFKSAVIWCRRFRVGFGVAPILP